MRTRLAPLLPLLLLACGGPPGAADLPAAPDGGGAPGAPDLSSGSADGGAGADGGETRCSVGASSDPLVVPTTRGLLQGKRAGDSAAFLGVPYAAPPVGARRFQPPAAGACWAGVRQATAYGSFCPQKNLLTGKAEGDEDCLFLNLWTPLRRPAADPARMPVLVFIHGGANMLGASNQQVLGNLYDGQDLAERQGAIVVTLNYRLGALGFLAHPALSAESPQRVSGNYALLDSIAALRWVKDNIAAFGGDPARVLIFGESAGAFATCALLASPLARGLFSAAIMQSGVCVAPTLVERQARGKEIAATLGCDGALDVAACLRRAPVDALLNTGEGIGIVDGTQVDLAHLWDLPFGFSVDGWALPEQPIRMIRAGRHNRVPFIVGSNADEMELFLRPAQVLTCLDYNRLVRDGFGPRAGEVLRRYPCGLLPRLDAVELLTDLVFTCPARRIARAAAAAQAEPVYRYYFTHAGPGALSVLRAHHAAELPFLFNSFAQIGVIPNLGEVYLSRSLQGYWARLAATGDSNEGGRPHWPRYEPLRDEALALDAIISTKEQIHAANCDYWDSLAQE